MLGRQLNPFQMVYKKFLGNTDSACQLLPEILLGQCLSQTSELRSSAGCLC